jgi:tetratricopeptide (TPR) repeat protein
VADVALQSTPFVRRRMLGSEWVPILGKLLARCPENDLRRRFKLLIRLGQLHRLNMKLESARSTLQKAEVAAGRLDDKNAQAETTYNLCRNYWRGRQYAEAERCARATLEILSDFEGAEAWLLAEGNRMLGVIADRRGELDKAEAFLRQSVAMWRDIDRPTELSRNIVDLSGVLRAAGKYDQAITMLNEAGRLLSPTTNQLDKTIVQMHLGVVYFDIGDLAAAEAAFRQADSTWLRRSGNRHHQAYATFNLGNVLLNQRRWGEAEPCLRRAVHLWKGMEIVRMLS